VAGRKPGERGRLGIEVAKRTFQRYIGRKPTPRIPNQTWSTFLKTHAKDVWTCDFVPVIDLLFRQLFVFFIVELESRRVVHFGVTRHPNQFWVSQQLREATLDGKRPRFILRDSDSKLCGLLQSIVAASRHRTERAWWSAISLC
jgi:putative transposase